jgi:hypothetical protein
MPDLVIRPAVQDDLEVLWNFLAIAAYEPDAEAAKAIPGVAKYLVGWQRPGDFGFIAEQNGEIIGAAWARRFSAEELKVPYGDEEAPNWRHLDRYANHRMMRSIIRMWVGVPINHGYRYLGGGVGLLDTVCRAGISTPQR